MMTMDHSPALPISSVNPPTPRVLSFRESRTLRYSQARLRYSQARLRYSQARLRYSQAMLRYSQARLRYFPTLRRRHDEDTRHMCLTTRHDESYVFNEVFGIARYAFVRGFRLVYTWEIYFTLNLKNLQKLFLFFSILFKEESIQKNKIFLF
jgi:hypothetical protein